MYYCMKKKALYSIFILIMVLGVWLHLWEGLAEKNAHYTPDYPKADLYPLLEKVQPDVEDYTLLFEQTGLGRMAVDTLWSEGRQQEIIRVQECFFEKVSVACRYNTVISKEESLYRDGEEYEVFIPVIEEGDILISFSTHVFGWRVGHAALVVDAAERKTLEARVLGTDSDVLSMSHWQRYPSFAVLRLKEATREERKQIAKSAAMRLRGVPYSLCSGIFEETVENGQKTDGTHCSHLVWSAFECYGYDLDSDQRAPVTPRDIFESPLLEVVQVYGMELKH